MNDAEVARALRPHGHCKVVPSEDDERELTPDQRNTYRWIRDAYDAAWIDRVLPTGVVWVVAQRGASISHIELSRDGIPI